MSLPVLEIPSKSAEELRKIVFEIINGQSICSLFVPEELWGMVFLPVGLGGLSPPEEQIAELIGKQPEPPEPFPPKPAPPNYENLPLPAPPEIPEHFDPDPSWEFQLRWDEIDKETYEANLSALKEANENGRKVWKAYRENVDATNREATATYRAQLRNWKRRCKRIETRQASQAEARAEWDRKYREISQSWVSKIGCLLGDLRNTSPMGVNGYPITFSVGCLNREDTKRIALALERERNREQSIEI